LVENELAESEPQRRKGPWKLILIVVLITLIGIWLVPGEAPDETPPSAPREAAAPSLLAEGEDTVATAPPAAPAEEVEIDDRPGSRARALIAQLRASDSLDLERAFSAAQKAQAAGELADAYLLYFFAARDGHAAAALTLGTQADPATRDPADSVFEDADLNQAHKWYQLAAQNGSSEAQDRLADLRSRIERLAADGDPLAQRITLLWQ
jgi:TPR repeat protein